jgi:hypothetical protein
MKKLGWFRILLISLIAFAGILLLLDNISAASCPSGYCGSGTYKGTQYDCGGCGSGEDCISHVCRASGGGSSCSSPKCYWNNACYSNGAKAYVNGHTYECSNGQIKMIDQPSSTCDSPNCKYGDNCYSNGANAIIGSNCYRCSSGDINQVDMSICSSGGAGSGDTGTGTAPCGGSTPCGSPGSCYAKTENKTWDPWSNWETCIGNIGSATMARNRSCISRGLVCGGSDQCSGSSQNAQNCSVLTNAVWADLNGNITNSSSVGDTVMMSIDGLGLADVNIFYLVYVRELASWRNLWGLLSRSYKPSELTEYPIYTLVNASDHYYNANTTNSNGLSTINSSILAVSQNSSTSNTMPVAVITHPNMSDFRFSNECNINFTQASYDEDDLLNITWNFGDGTTNSTQNYFLALTPNIANTNHSYALPGVYTVSLTAAEMARGQSDTAYTSISILKEGLNVMPVITLPENGVGYGMWVAFNASQSYVVNCSLNMINPDFMACSLKCKYIHEPGTNATQMIGRNYDLRMNWLVKNPAGAEELGTSGNWSTNYTNVVEFSNFFENPGQHNAVLTMDYIQK